MPVVTKQVQGSTLFRMADVSSVDAEKRTVDLVWTTGSKGKRRDWFGDEWYEELAVDSASIRMDRLNSGAPLLDSHSQWSVGSVLGVVERASIEGGKGVATVRFSQRADVDPIFQDVKDGIIRNVSVGYRVYKWTEVSADDDKIPTMRATDWEPMELSLVPVGFDPGAQTRSDDKRRPDAPFSMDVTFKRSATQGAQPTPQGGKKRMDEEQQRAAEKAAEEAKRAAELKAAKEAAAKEAVDAERKRSAEITRLVRSVRLDDAFAQELIGSGKSLDEARSAILDKKAAEGDQTRTTSVRGVELGDEDIKKRASGIENAILHRCDPTTQKLDDNGRRFRSMSLLEMGRRHLEAQGVEVGDWDKRRLAREVTLVRSGGLSSTSDYPAILANVANKFLLMNYDRLAARQTFRPFVRVGNIPDFKQVSKVRAAEMPSLITVPEGGEVRRGSFGDAKEVYSLSTYSRIFAITREAIINDDLGAFTDLPSRYALAAARLESDQVWAIITGNPNMSDSVALFNSAHANVDSAGAISVTTIGTGRSKMMTQKGLSGKDPLNIVPKFLVVPAALQTLADQFVTTAMLANQPSATNPFAGKLQVIAEARLDVNSTSKWYLFADPGDGVDIIEIGYLDGQAGPKVETQLGWEINGIEIKATHDFGCKALDWRGVFGNGSF